MEIVNLYRCEFCGKESRYMERIEEHEAECREAHQRKLLVKENIEKWNEEFLNTFDPNHVDECINTYVKKVHGLTFNNIRWSVSYSPEVKNTHGCPINGVENFNGVINKPKGYAGFHGNIRGDYSEGKTLSSSEIKVPGMHTGTGSGNGIDWQYAFYFFLDDFPHLKKEFKETQRVKVAKAYLSGNYNYTINMSYSNER